MKPELVVDYARDFPNVGGYFGYFWFKIKLNIHVFYELLIMGTMIIVYDNMLLTVIMQFAKRSRNQ